MTDLPRKRARPSAEEKQHPQSWEEKTCLRLGDEDDSHSMEHILQQWVRHTVWTEDREESLGSWQGYKPAALTPRQAQLFHPQHSVS